MSSESYSDSVTPSRLLQSHDISLSVVPENRGRPLSGGSNTVYSSPLFSKPPSQSTSRSTLRHGGTTGISSEAEIQQQSTTSHRVFPPAPPLISHHPSSNVDSFRDRKSAPPNQLDHFEINDAGNLPMNRFTPFTTIRNCPPEFNALPDRNVSRKWSSVHSGQHDSTSDEHYIASVSSSDLNNIMNFDSYRSAIAHRKPSLSSHCSQRYQKPELPQPCSHQQWRLPAIYPDPPWRLTLDSSALTPCDGGRSGLFSGDYSKQRQKLYRHNALSEEFHTVYLKRISPPGCDRFGRFESSQLHLEFLSHLQGIMQDIVPNSHFRLHGGIMSRSQIRAAPIEVSWDLPPHHGNADPLRVLFNTLRRQKPTPLKYLFRCSSNALTTNSSSLSSSTSFSSSSPTPSYFLSQLTVKDLVSQLSCHITLNNNWSVVFSTLVLSYSSIHPAIQIGTQCILHWGIKSGIVIPPPLAVSGSSNSTIPGNHRPPRSAPVTEASRGSVKPDSSISLPTHANLSVILVLWIRYLIEKYPQIVPSTELLMDHLDLPSIQTTDTVENILHGFFDFYRTVDFSTSVISIRSGAPPLYRLRIDQPSPISRSSTLVVLDPILDRNLSGSWQVSQVISFLQHLQNIPWSLELFYALQSSAHRDITDADNESYHGRISPTLLSSPRLLSRWLAFLFDDPLTMETLQHYEVVEDLYHHTPSQFDTANCLVETGRTTSQSPNFTSTMCERSPTDFPSRTDLIADIQSMRLVQQILSDKVRFLRNEVWWLERQAAVSHGVGSGTRLIHCERTENLATDASSSRRFPLTPDEEPQHWTSIHFGLNKEVNVGDSNEPTAGESTSPLLPPQNSVAAQFRWDVNEPELWARSSTRSKTRHSSEYFNKEGFSSPLLRGLDGATTTTVSTPPVIAGQGSARENQLSVHGSSRHHTNEMIDYRLNDTAATLLKLTGCSNESDLVGLPLWNQLGKESPLVMDKEHYNDLSTLTPNPSSSSSSLPPPTVHHPFLTEKKRLVTKCQLWDLDLSTSRVQHLMQELLQDCSGTSLAIQHTWSRVEKTPFLTTSASLIQISRIQESSLQSVLPSNYKFKEILPEAYECSSTVPVFLALLPSSLGYQSSERCTSIDFSVSWKGPSVPQVGFLKPKSRFSLTKIPTAEFMKTIRLLKLTILPTISTSIRFLCPRNPLNGSLLGLDAERNQTRLLTQLTPDNTNTANENGNLNPQELNSQGAPVVAVPFIRTPEFNDGSKSDIMIILWSTDVRDISVAAVSKA